MINPEGRPLCKCHGEPMVAPSGWRCAKKTRANVARYFRTEKGTISHRARVSRYACSEKGRISKHFRNIRYERTNKGIEMRYRVHQRAWIKEVEARHEGREDIVKKISKLDEEIRRLRNDKRIKK